MSDDQITLPDDEPDRAAKPDGVSDAEGAPEPPAQPEVPTCPECGNPLEEGQPYCLECGAPTPWAPKLRRGVGPAGILAIGLLALGVGAGALAYAIVNEDDTTAGQVSVPTQPTTSLPSIPSVPTFTTPSVDQTDTFPTFPTFPTVPTTTFPPPTFGTGTSPTGPATGTGATTAPGTTTAPTITTEPPETTTQPPPTTRGADEWPDGVSGWTVILASTSSQRDATAFRDKVKASGRSAGLIDSSLYSSLQPDLWVVYSGQYSNRTQAINQAAALRGTYPGAYAQRIEE
jgi:cell division septation protein DedD